MFAKPVIIGLLFAHGRAEALDEAEALRKVERRRKARGAEPPEKSPRFGSEIFSTEVR